MFRTSRTKSSKVSSYINNTNKKEVNKMRLNTLDKIKVRAALEGCLFNVVITDIDNGCTVTYGFGFIDNSVLVEEIDEYGIDMGDDCISKEDAFKELEKLVDSEFSTVDIQEVEEINSIYA